MEKQNLIVEVTNKVTSIIYCSKRNNNNNNNNNNNDANNCNTKWPWSLRRTDQL